MEQRRRADFEEDGRREFSEQRKNDGNVGNKKSRESDGGEKRSFDIAWQENNSKRNGESGTTDDSVIGKASRELSIEDADYSRELESIEKMREEYRERSTVTKKPSAEQRKRIGCAQCTQVHGKTVPRYRFYKISVAQMWDSARDGFTPNCF